MILPSDGETPSSDDSREDSAEDYAAWKDDAAGDDLLDDDDFPEEDDADTEDDDYEAAAPDMLPIQAPAGPGWRRRLQRILLECIEDLKEIEDPDQEFDPPEPPDLYTFFGELAALRNEMRAGLKKAERASAVPDAILKEVLQTFTGTQKSQAAASTWPQESCLALAALYDLLLEARPDQSIDIPFDHLLRQAGMERIHTEGKAFDPALMTAAAVETVPGREPGQVLRETTAGFIRNGTLLRPARVIITG